MRFSARGLGFSGALLAAAVLIAQPDWKTVARPPAVDFSNLTPVQSHALLRLLRNHDCTCGCGMKIAECRVNDPQCVWSKGVAAAMGDALRAGKNENDAVAAAKASKWGQGPAQPKLLEDPVKIPTAGSPFRGPENAAVTLVEFSDFQCPYCSLAVGKLNAVLAAYPGKVKLVFKQFPLDTHSQAALAAAAAMAAHRQGKFWQMHDAMFENRQNLSLDNIRKLAQNAGLDMKRFDADLPSEDVKKAVVKDMDDGDKAGVEGTPSVYIDGKKYNGSLDLPAIKTIIDAELKSAH